MIEIKKFQHCTDTELSMILGWRNDPAVRAQMSTQDIISPEAHKAFVAGLSSTKDKAYCLVLDGGRALGVIDLVGINCGSAELGIYKNPELSGQAIGDILMDALSRLAAQKRIDRLILKVLHANERAIDLYRRHGFIETGGDESYLYMEKNLDTGVMIVAELSANHNHELGLALHSIEAAAEAGASAVKIQTYTADTLTIDCKNDCFKIAEGTIWDGSYLYDLYKEAYTPWEWHPILRDRAEQLGMLFFSTPFDNSATDYLESMDVPIYKIASFEITDIPLIKYVASKGKPIILSTGIAEIGEIFEAVAACRSVGNEDITLLKCTSSYPAPIEEANLATMVNMASTFGVKIGLSDHTLGGDTAIAAAALGASVIEKHFILDRKIGGPDASFSMEPIEFAAMVRSIRNARNAIGKVNYQLTEKQRAGRKFVRSLFVVEDVSKGEVFTERNVRVIRPGDGIAPKYISKVFRSIATRDIKRGEPLLFEHCSFIKSIETSSKEY